MADVVRVSGLTKRFGTLNAVDHLDLAIPHGTIGLVGANGAGKTTLMRMLLGLTQPTAGAIEVCGFNVATNPIGVRERVGFMPEHDCLPTDQSASDIVSTLAEISGIPAREARRRASEVLDLVGLDEARFRPIEGFSTGMRQRVKLAQAIVSHPDLVLLDEPTAGLDPSGRIEMLDLIRRLASFGISVLLSTHLLEDVERTCSYVVMLNAGKLVVQGDTARLLAGTGTTVIDVGPNVGIAMPALTARGLTIRQVSGDEIEINAAPELISNTVCSVLAELNLPLVRLSSSHQSLDQIFVRQAAMQQSAAS